VAAVFTGFQVNMYADDVEPGVAFYAALGLEETYRYAPAGEPLHVELRGGGLTIGIASVRAAREEHGLEVSQEGAAMELVLWWDDVDAAYARALAAGATAMREPHDFQDGRLRVGWVMDPLGNPLELVQTRAT
jgi:predicted enzyme related to lactoylglutathione lyase